MTPTNPNTPTPQQPHHNSQAAPLDSIQPWLIFGFILTVLVIVVAAAASGIDTDGLAAITAATVAIVGAAVAALKAWR